MPQIAEILAESGYRMGDLDRIAVGVGPGSFTGLRIGVATARALALARDMEIVGVSTLESLALNAEGLVCAVLDARRSEVFAATWDRGEPVFSSAALSPEELAEKLAGLREPPLAVGEGAIAFRDVLKESGALIPDDASHLHRVTAVNHCRLGLDARAGDAHEVLPDYLRLPDAELSSNKP
jgi:tRNA threonylcarbamoyladenosine biosynthesis protein TsaB